MWLLIDFFPKKKFWKVDEPKISYFLFSFYMVNSFWAEMLTTCLKFIKPYSSVNFWLICLTSSMQVQAQLRDRLNILSIQIFIVWNYANQQNTPVFLHQHWIVKKICLFALSGYLETLPISSALYSWELRQWRSYLGECKTLTSKYPYYYVFLKAKSIQTSFPLLSTMLHCVPLFFLFFIWSPSLLTMDAISNSLFILQLSFC